VVRLRKIAVFVDENESDGWMKKKRANVHFPSVGQQISGIKEKVFAAMKYIYVLIAAFILVACNGPSTQQNASDDQRANVQKSDTLDDKADSVGAVENRGSDTAKWWEKLPRADWALYERVLNDVDWFEVYRVAPDTYAIYEPGQFEEVISFLIVGDLEAVLFDTGLGVASIQKIISMLTDKKITVINSHGHYDHIGGNHEFDMIAGLDNVYTAKRNQGMPNEEVGVFVAGDWLAKKPAPSFDPKNYEIKSWTANQVIKDGAAFDLGGRVLEVIETPGHAPDALCLLDRENRLLFMGDTFYLAPLYSHLGGSDFATYKASIDYLATLEPQVDYLMTAHNVPKVEARYLGVLKSAFQAVEDKSAPFVETDGALEYSFDGFSIIVPDE